MKIMGKNWDITPEGEIYLDNYIHYIAGGGGHAPGDYSYTVLGYIHRMPESSTKEIIEFVHGIKGINVTKIIRVMKELEEKGLIRVSPEIFEHTTRLISGSELEDATITEKAYQETMEEGTVEYPFGADPNRFLLRYDEALLTEEKAANLPGVKEYFENRELKGLRENN